MTHYDGDPPEDMVWACSTMMIHVVGEIEQSRERSEEYDPMLLEAARSNADLVLLLDKEYGEQYWANPAQIHELITCFTTAARLFAGNGQADKVAECHALLTKHAERLIPRVPTASDWEAQIEATKIAP